jgi:hypothetical protein
MGNLDELVPLIFANPGGLVALLPLATLAYLAPFLIAFERRHRFLWTIGVINLTTGWTILGWLAALLWAVNKDVRNLLDELPARTSEAPLEPQWNLAPQEDSPPVGGRFKQCPYCAEPIRPEAIVCRYCSRDLVASAEVRSATDLGDEERRQLESLLTDHATSAPQDPNLLDVFEYARLLEAEESAAILARVGVANLSSQAFPARSATESVLPPTEPVPDPIESATPEESDSDWMLDAPIAGRRR